MDVFEFAAAVKRAYQRWEEHGDDELLRLAVCAALSDLED